MATHSLSTPPVTKLATVLGRLFPFTLPLFALPLFALPLVVVLPLGRAIGETRPRVGSTLRTALLDQPLSFDPYQASTHSELTLAGLLFDSLYYLKPDGTVAPELATSLPKISEDNLEWNIPIRVGARFHNRRKLAVSDVVASMTRLMAGPSGWLLASVEDVSASSDGTTLIFRLRYIEPALLSQLASPVAAITPSGKRPGRKPLGTGPFRFDGIDRAKREIRLSAFRDHHRGRPYLNRLILRWYESFDDEARAYEVGRVHVSFRGAVAFSGHVPKYKTESVAAPASILAYVGFGTGLGQAQPKLLADRDFRHALSLAINRNGLAKLGTGERIVPTDQPVSSTVGRSPKHAALRAQVAKSRIALARAARRHPLLQHPAGLNLQILINRSRPDDRDIADKILAATAKLGISATVVEVGAAVFDKRVKRGATDLYIGQLAAPLATESAQISAAFTSGGDGWARRSLARGPLKRASAYAEFSRRLPLIPLLHRSITAHHRVDLHGLVFDGEAQTEWADVFFFGEPTRN